MRLALAAAAVLLAACTGKPNADDPLLSERTLDLEEFFVGETVARGQFQDIFGTVRRRFDVTVNGTWDGETLKLVEDFVYEDGSTEFFDIGRDWWQTRNLGPDHPDYAEARDAHAACCRDYGVDLGTLTAAA